MPSPFVLFRDSLERLCRAGCVPHFHNFFRATLPFVVRHRIRCAGLCFEVLVAAQGT